MKFAFLLLALLVGLALSDETPPDNWVTEGGKTVKGLTCSTALDKQEDFVDQVQAAAKVLGGRRSGPVRRFVQPEKNNPYFFPPPSS